MIDKKIQWIVSGGLFLFVLAFRFLGGESEETSGNEAPSKPKNLDPDVQEKNKIMSEMGKKGAQKSAEVRRAKKAAREASKNELSA